MLREGHGELWTNYTSTSNGFDDLVFVTVFNLVLGVLFVVLWVFVVLVVVVLLLVELCLLLRLLKLLLGIFTVEVLLKYVLSLSLRRYFLFFLRLLLVLCLLLLLCSSLHAASKTFNPAGKCSLLGLVDLELEELFVLLGHPEVAAFHLARQQRRQVVEEAV